MYPSILLDQFVCGNCILLLGAQMSAETLVRAAEGGDSASRSDRPLSIVARIYQAVLGRKQTDRQLPEEDKGMPGALHQAVAGLPIRRMVDFSSDRRLEKALLAAKRPYTLALVEHELPDADPNRVLLLKPFVAVERGEAPDIARLITEDDYDNLLSTADLSHTLLIEQLRLWAANQALLWVGIDPGNAGWQRLHERLVEGIPAQKRCEYALVDRLELVEKWQALGVEAQLALNPAGWLMGLAQAAAVAPLYAQQDTPDLRLDVPDLELPLRAALESGIEPAYWARRAAGGGLDPWPLLAAALDAPQETRRIQAVRALAGWESPQALEALQRAMVDASPRLRLAAHQALYALGTPQTLAILDTSNDLRLVPGGEFSMGSDLEKREKPIHVVNLPAFFIEKYLVTNEKYNQFFESGGYADPRYWTRTGWEWVLRVGRVRQAFSDDPRFNPADYPVVGVTWFEAMAYACWAGRRLLTEAEWEKAASWEPNPPSPFPGREGEERGGGRKRKYPWGDEFDKKRCTTSELELIFTTPVSKYSPDGDSPYGCADMAGNVWEWMSSLYWPYPYRADDGREDVDAAGNRVQRGGSWRYNREFARCACRSLDEPLGALTNVGFRCGSAAEPAT